MPIDVISYIMPVILVLWNAFLLAIPAFFVVHIGNWLRKRLEAKAGSRQGKAGSAGRTGKESTSGKESKKETSLAKNSFIATYAIVFIVLLVIYALPFVSAWQAIDNSLTPPELNPTDTEWAAFLGLQAIKLALVSLVFALMLLPFEFAGLWIYEQLSLKREINRQLSIFASCFAISAIILTIIIVLPWVLPGLIYLIYFA